jgi:hypothetical protein
LTSSKVGTGSNPIHTKKKQVQKRKSLNLEAKLFKNRNGLPQLELLSTIINPQPTKVQKRLAEECQKVHGTNGTVRIDS